MPVIPTNDPNKAITVELTGTKLLLINRIRKAQPGWTDEMIIGWLLGAGELLWKTEGGSRSTWLNCSYEYYDKYGVKIIES